MEYPINESRDINHDRVGDITGTVTEKVVLDPLTDMPGRFVMQQQKSQIHIKVKPLDLKTPVHDDRIRFVCISDTHSRLSLEKCKASKTNYFIPPGDVLLHAGDLALIGTHTEIEEFNSYIGNLPHKKKVVIAGNHDLPFDEGLFTEYISDRYEEMLFDVKTYMRTKGVQFVKDLLTNVVYLQDSMVTICGINIYGSPWTPLYRIKGAFNARRGAEILQKWNCIPEHVDILMTHGPPAGQGDVTDRGINAGCVELLQTVQKRVKPKYHVYGHIHEGYGITTDGVTTFINASSCTAGLKLGNPPIIFDISLPPGQSKDNLLDKVDIVAHSY